MDFATLGHRVGRTARAALEPVGKAATAPSVVAPGFKIASAAALAWGKILGGDVRREGELNVVSGLPSWAFGRGGTTVGNTFLTRDSVSSDILEHEDVHRKQWERYGLAFIPMYFAAGIDATKNKWEIEAGLEKGGYVRSGNATSAAAERAEVSDEVRETLKADAAAASAAPQESDDSPSTHEH